MVTIERFEDVEAWQLARTLNRTLYQLTTKGPFARDFGLRDQLRRAAVSVMSCIAEGFEHGSDKEFKRYLTIAKASAGEVRSLLYVADDLGYIDGVTANELRSKTEDISRLIAAFIRYLEASNRQ